MTPPGAFTGVLAAGSWDRRGTNFISVDACLPLPPAVPVHPTHDGLRPMIGIAVPWLCPDYFRDGEDAIVIDAVLSSRARKAFERVSAREVYLSPWWTNMRWSERGGKDYATTATIASADLVASPRDKRATITSVTPFERMTDAQLDVQRRLDEYIADAQPSCIDILDAVGRAGREALEPLWDIVRPIRAEWLTSRRAA